MNTKRKRSSDQSETGADGGHNSLSMASPGAAREHNSRTTRNSSTSTNELNEEQGLMSPKRKQLCATGDAAAAAQKIYRRSIELTTFAELITKSKDTNSHLLSSAAASYNSDNEPIFCPPSLVRSLSMPVFLKKRERLHATKTINSTAFRGKSASDATAEALKTRFKPKTPTPSVDSNSDNELTNEDVVHSQRLALDSINSPSPTKKTPQSSIRRPPSPRKYIVNEELEKRRRWTVTDFYPIRTGSPKSPKRESSSRLWPAPPTRIEYASHNAEPQGGSRTSSDVFFEDAVYSDVPKTTYKVVSHRPQLASSLSNNAQNDNKSTRGSNADYLYVGFTQPGDIDKFAAQIGANFVVEDTLQTKTIIKKKNPSRGRERRDSNHGDQVACYGSKAIPRTNQGGEPKKTPHPNQGGEPKKTPHPSSPVMRLKKLQETIAAVDPSRCPKSPVRNQTSMSSPVMSLKKLQETIAAVDTSRCPKSPVRNQTSMPSTSIPCKMSSERFAPLNLAALNLSPISSFNPYQSSMSSIDSRLKEVREIIAAIQPIRCPKSSDCNQTTQSSIASRLKEVGENIASIQLIRCPKSPDCNQTTKLSVAMRLKKLQEAIAAVNSCQCPKLPFRNQTSMPSTSILGKMSSERFAPLNLAALNLSPISSLNPYQSSMSPHEDNTFGPPSVSPTSRVPVEEPEARAFFYETHPSAMNCQCKDDNEGTEELNSRVPEEGPKTRAMNCQCKDDNESTDELNSRVPVEGPETRAMNCQCEEDTESTEELISRVPLEGPETRAMNCQCEEDTKSTEELNFPVLLEGPETRAMNCQCEEDTESTEELNSRVPVEGPETRAMNCQCEDDTESTEELKAQALSEGLENRAFFTETNRSARKTCESFPNRYTEDNNPTEEESTHEQSLNSSLKQKESSAAMRLKKLQEKIAAVDPSSCPKSPVRNQTSMSPQTSPLNHSDVQIYNQYYSGGSCTSPIKSPSSFGGPEFFSLETDHQAMNFQTLNEDQNMEKLGYDFSKENYVEHDQQAAAAQDDVKPLYKERRIIEAKVVCPTGVSLGGISSVETLEIDDIENKPHSPSWLPFGNAADLQFDLGTTCPTKKKEAGKRLRALRQTIKEQRQGLVHNESPQWPPRTQQHNKRDNTKKKEGQNHLERFEIISTMGTIDPADIAVNAATHMSPRQHQWALTRGNKNMKPHNIEEVDPVCSNSNQVEQEYEQQPDGDDNRLAAAWVHGRNDANTDGVRRRYRHQQTTPQMDETNEVDDFSKQPVPLLSLSAMMLPIRIILITIFLMVRLLTGIGSDDSQPVGSQPDEAGSRRSNQTVSKGSRKDSKPSGRSSRLHNSSSSVRVNLTSAAGAVAKTREKSLPEPQETATYVHNYQALRFEDNDSLGDSHHQPRIHKSTSQKSYTTTHKERTAQVPKESALEDGSDCNVAEVCASSERSSAVQSKVDIDSRAAVVGGSSYKTPDSDDDESSKESTDSQVVIGKVTSEPDKENKSAPMPIYEVVCFDEKQQYIKYSEDSSKNSGMVPPDVEKDATEEAEQSVDSVNGSGKAAYFGSESGSLGEVNDSEDKNGGENVDAAVLQNGRKSELTKYEGRKSKQRAKSVTKAYKDNESYHDYNEAEGN